MRTLTTPLLAAIAGGLLTLSLAPFNYWWCSLLSLALLAWLYLPAKNNSDTLSAKRGYWIALCYGFGLFASGGSWVYVSITDFGGSSAFLGLLLTAGFVGILALALALPFALMGRFIHNRFSFALAFAVLWFASEWLRSWLFTGFPWLFAGYAHHNTWLAGWAPVLSVYGIGLMLAFSAAALALLARGALWPLQRPAHIAILTAALILWPAGALLKKIDWTESAAESIKVGLVQANIPQDKKWLPEFRGETISRYQNATETLHQQRVDVIIWPEAALPLLYNQAPNLMQALQRNSEQAKTDLISGILYDSEQDQRRVIHNSAAVFGASPQLYHKRHLVPFGEYVPLEDWLRGTIEFFSLPTSFIRPGPDQQQPLHAGGVSWAPLICYEIVYPQLVANSAAGADVLLTISNDAWFGKSIGPLQHMQMAQMRALETRRYLVRGTNTGVTAIVDPSGKITAQLPQFEQATLTGTVVPMRGSTPFMLFGIWGLLTLALPMLLTAILLQRQPAAKSDTAFARQLSD